MTSELLYEKVQHPEKVVNCFTRQKKGNKMTGKGMSVGLRCSVLGHTVGFEQGK